MFSEIFRTIFASILTIVYIVLFYTILCLVSPIYFLRFYLGKVARHVSPELDSILSPASTLLHQPRLNIVITFVVDDYLEIADMRDLFKSKVITNKLPNGELKYPELQQYVTKWCGFLFWKWDRNFMIENHVRKCTPEELNNFQSVQEFAQHLEETSMIAENKSPWEFLLIQNHEILRTQNDINCKNVVLFRLSHSLADGHSIIKLLYNAMADHSMEPIMPTSSAVHKMTTKNKFLKWAQLFYYCTGKIYQLFYNPKMFFDTHQWHLRQSVDNEKFISALSRPMSIKKAKEIQKLHGVCLPSVVIALVTGTLRKFMIESEIDIPQEIRICYPLPLANHPDTLKNHFVLAEIATPIGTADPVIRLQEIRRNIENLKSGPVPFMIEILTAIFGGLFYPLAIWISRVRWVTLVLSNFPTPVQLVLFGKNVSEFNFINGIPNGHTGILVSCMGYTDKLQFAFQFKKSLVSHNDKQLQDAVNEYLEQEMYILLGKA